MRLATLAASVLAVALSAALGAGNEDPRGATGASEVSASHDDGVPVPHAPRPDRRP